VQPTKFINLGSNLNLEKIIPAKKIVIDEQTESEAASQPASE